MKRNVNGSHSLKAKTRPRGGGPCSCSQGNPSMLQARLKAALSVNSKLFLLQTRNDNNKKNITQIWDVENTTVIAKVTFRNAEHELLSKCLMCGASLKTREEVSVCYKG